MINVLFNHPITGLPDLDIRRYLIRAQSKSNKTSNYGITFYASRLEHSRTNLSVIGLFRLDDDSPENNNGTNKETIMVRPENNYDE